LEAEKLLWRLLRTRVRYLWNLEVRGIIGAASTPEEIIAVVSGQIKLRWIDGWQKIAAVLSQHAKVAA